MMTLQEAVAELAEGSANLNPLLDRLQATVKRIDDVDLTRQMTELVHLNGRMWTAVSDLIHHAEDKLKKEEVPSRFPNDYSDMGYREFTCWMTGRMDFEDLKKNLLYIAEQRIREALADHGLRLQANQPLTRIVIDLDFRQVEQI